ncbi:hypothetical protein WA538_002233 [Blastocystis sp. DL]
MDMWPSTELYSTLINLPASYLKEDKNVCIVPSWEYIMEPNAQCNTFQNCIERIYTLLPGTKQELRRCVEDRFCFRFRESSNTHNYHTDDWFDLPSDTYVRELPCMFNDVQEPYVFVKRSPSLPRFDERFVDYGKNKVQFVSHLRMLGYKYYVLSQSFAIDVPHPRSKISTDWLVEGTATNWKTRMHIAYDEFKEEVLKQTEQVTIQTPLCS